MYLVNGNISLGCLAVARKLKSAWKNVYIRCLYKLNSQRGGQFSYQFIVSQLLVNSSVYAL